MKVTKPIQQRGRQVLQDKSTIAAGWRQKLISYAEKHSVTKAAARYRVSRKTIYKWKNRYDGTTESLRDRSRRPHSNPQETAEEELRKIRKRLKQFRWTDLIQAYQRSVEKDGYEKSYGCFRRQAAKLKGRKKNRKPCKPKYKVYERAAYPGQKIQIDVKYVPSKCVLNRKKYYQYTAVDECTRWTYREMYEEHSTYSSKDFLEELIRKAPFPIRMVQTDNGTEFTNTLLVTKSKHKTLFEAALEGMGILYKRIRIATPRHNGKVERQHRIDQERFYDHLKMYSLEDGRKQLAAYQKKSNDIMKTCLNMRTPNQMVEKYLGVM